MPALPLHPTLDQRQLIPITAAAEQLDISPRTIRRRIEDGTLPAYRVGRLLKIDPADLDRIAQPVAITGAGETA